ncbi:tetratricopeptide-like helical domain, DYW domain protein [Tanacetum coccineum]|uniref:Tetratricopeptide-like helical domain, DYW domain protein n=1 Tax=Tanacetum coccineum TaxID=301880 RepID=A0ABQ5C3I9_9ASTR
MVLESAHGDILRHGFLPGYTEWTVHGEHNISLPPSQSTIVNVEEIGFRQEDIRGLVRDALELLRDAFSHLTTLPSFADEAKKFTKDLGLDPRSVRLGLASDGFNPFCTMSTSHSAWPVLLITYNLPPLICMKRQSFILSSIILGEKAPDIGVYLKPLIKELQLLWKGVDAYDAFSKQHFKMREEDVGSTSTHAKEATHDNEGAFECINTIIEEDIDGENLLWKKKSVFFDLEYWELNLLRHNLDVMHIEKNMSDNILGTLLDLDGKTKDKENTWLCAKVLDPSELDKMEYQLVRTLCELE